MALPTITVVGGLTADPELRFTSAGKAVLGMRVGASERRKNQAGEWEDGDRVYLNVSLWEAEAEAAAEHFQRGDQVIVTGQLYQRDYETRDGSKGQSMEVKFAKVAKLPPRQSSSQSAPQQGGAWGAPSPQPADPWGAPANPSDQPPF